MTSLSVRLQNTLLKEEPLLRAISEQSAHAKPATNGWSKKQELGHLIDSAVNNRVRFIKAADYRPHTRAGNRIDRDVLLVQHLQNADVRYSARAASRKDEPDPRPVGRRRHFRGGGVRGVLRRSRGRSREPENGTKNAEYPETGPDRPW